MQARREYNPSDAAYRVLQKLPGEQLADKKAVCEALRRHKIKLSGQGWGKVRKRILTERGEGGATATNGVGIEQRITLVARTAKRVGGLDRLEEAIAIIRKVQQL